MRLSLERRGAGRPATVTLGRLSANLDCVQPQLGQQIKAQFIRGTAAAMATFVNEANTLGTRSQS
jgi:hypothetical protein